MYEKGKGVARDLRRAKELHKLAPCAGRARAADVQEVAPILPRLRVACGGANECQGTRRVRRKHGFVDELLAVVDRMRRHTTVRTHGTEKQLDDIGVRIPFQLMLLRTVTALFHFSGKSGLDPFILNIAQLPTRIFRNLINLLLGQNKIFSKFQINCFLEIEYSYF